MKKITILFLFLSVLVFAQKSTLKKQISQIIKGKNATVAVSIKGLDFPFNYGNQNASKKLPMQSVFKFHIALAVLDLVDKGQLKLDQKVYIKKSELLPDTWSPIREKYPQGNFEMSVSDLIYYAVAMSDNVGCDVLLRLIGGPKVVNDYIIFKGGKNTQIVFNEEIMQSEWENQYQNFTTTKSAIQLLEQFFKGKMISPISTEFLMKVMLGTTTGTNKIVEQLPNGTPVAHKTGFSGRNKDGLVGAENDIAIITLPNGKHYTLSIFVSDSTETNEVNCKMISDISKVVWDYLNEPKSEIFFHLK